MSPLDETLKDSIPIHMQPPDMSYRFVKSLNIMTPCKTSSGTHRMDMVICALFSDFSGIGSGKSSPWLPLMTGHLI